MIETPTMYALADVAWKIASIRMTEWIRQPMRQRLILSGDHYGSGAMILGIKAMASIATAFKHGTLKTASRFESCLQA